MSEPLETPQVLFRDERLLVLDKPPGWVIHRSPMAPRGPNLVGWARDRLGVKAFPAHRIDRPTSGVVLFALTSEGASLLGEQVRARGLRRTYFALARGWLDDEGRIEKAIPNDAAEGAPKVEAVTRYATVARAELPVAVSDPRHPTSRYSLLRVTPETGRYHQIRKHLRWVSHPIVGDTWYGDGRQNAFFRERFGYFRLGLMARELAFQDPGTGEERRFTAPWPGDFLRLAKELGWEGALLGLEGQAGPGPGVHAADDAHLPAQG